MSRIQWDEHERAALARAMAEQFHEAKMGTVPSMTGNAQFLKPLIMAAQKKALKEDRLRPLFPSIGPVVKRWWPLVQPELDKLREPVNGHEVLPPAPPPPPPPPEKTLADFSDGDILTSCLGRILKALATRQQVIIPGLDELQAGTAHLVSQSTARDLAIQELTARVSDLGNHLKVMKLDLQKFKPPPPSVFVLGASPDTQKFLRNKSDEAHLEIDFRFIDVAATARAFKADYVIHFGHIGADWDRQVQLAVPKSHVCYVGGRHDAAMIQLKDWLG